jgi:hypothetical protein
MVRASVVIAEASTSAEAVTDFVENLRAVDHARREVEQCHRRREIDQAGRDALDKRSLVPEVDEADGAADSSERPNKRKERTTATTDFVESNVHVLRLMVAEREFHGAATYANGQVSHFLSLEVTDGCGGRSGAHLGSIAATGAAALWRAVTAFTKRS